MCAPDRRAASATPCPIPWNGPEQSTTAQGATASSVADQAERVSTAMPSTGGPPGRRSPAADRSARTRSREVTISSTSPNPSG